MDYRQALYYIYSFTDFEKSPALLYNAANYDLRRMEALLGHLAHPEEAVPSIHVAGTKGKGSTAAILASVLTAAGYRTGLYTSPHLHTLRERIQLDGQPIAQEALAAIVERVGPAVEATHGDSTYGRLTTFEVLTAVAFLHFKEQGARFQVVEAGLGGRLDATNVLASRVAVITSISYDHMDILGRTLSEIASQKAGIIKAGNTVAVAPQPEEALKVIEARCQEENATAVLVGKDVTWEPGPFDLTGQSVSVMGRLRKYGLRLSLLGRHQLENTATAVAALEVLQEQGVTIPGLALRQGLTSVRWPGRFEVLGQRPCVVVDGAHNEDSARRLCQTVEDYFPGQKVVLVMGTSRDKDVPAMARELAPICRSVIVTSSRNPRAASLAELAGVWSNVGQDAIPSPSVAAAIDHACGLASPDGLVLVTGSLFVVAEAREHILGLAPDAT